ncbi:uncharacterized protein TrAFT101_007423 [Trichoderma asperellum]|uniref:Uncharacterized protein n=1 Tax=Trichoderma asperellum (strain ATCC 204424 / CBS 433.97 / NBRC 101777) TaxID=1042311 RepID=A0A2T3YVV6_TRIA4|nr:hypothetical protein M441DRAFT_83351 [Trichoderma asperellum CBS 433.97]PTB36699.1 hypothetical protein M441DRAFT_83351 [Trichoderma asperellum CBS 433.97]UKZ92469.1 hypothetical protein TrAFT101_007423 [Trichoderma asperellum]
MIQGSGVSIWRRTGVAIQVNRTLSRVDGQPTIVIAAYAFVLAAWSVRRHLKGYDR